MITYPKSVKRKTNLGEASSRLEKILATSTNWNGITIYRKSSKRFMKTKHTNRAKMLALTIYFLNNEIFSTNDISFCLVESLLDLPQNRV